MNREVQVQTQNAAETRDDASILIELVGDGKDGR